LAAAEGGIRIVTLFFDEDDGAARFGRGLTGRALSFPFPFAFAFEVEVEVEA
jgi:hypothetical protein